MREKSDRLCEREREREKLLESKCESRPDETKNKISRELFNGNLIVVDLHTNLSVKCHGIIIV